MMKHIVIILISICLLIGGGVAGAETLPLPEGLVENNGMITGTIDTDFDCVLEVNMPEPQSIPLMKQYKVKRLDLSRKEINALLDGKIKPPQSGEQWVLRYGELAEHRQFLYQEDSMMYLGLDTVFKSIQPSALSDDPIYEKIDAVAKSIMDELGVAYEYPFYTLCNAAHGYDVSLRGIQIQTSAQLERLFGADQSENGKYEYQLYWDKQLLQNEYYYVRVRILAGDTPCSIFSIKSPSYSQDNPKHDEGVYVGLVFTDKGEIVGADASNLFTIAKEADDPQPILTWQECMEAFSCHEGCFSGHDAAKIISAELCYSINDKGITYPVWQFIVEYSRPDASFPWDYLCWVEYIDAHTGACL